MTTIPSAQEAGLSQQASVLPNKLGALAVPDFAELEAIEASVDTASDKEVVESITAYANSLGIVTGRPETYDDVYERELQFFGKVYDAVMEMSDGHDDKVVLIFDVDQTIAEGISKERVIRPAFPWVVTALHEALGDRLQIGLLTSLTNDGDAYDSFLAGIKPGLINRDYLLCTRDYDGPSAPADLPTGGDNDSMYLSAIEDIIDPAIAKAVKAGVMKTKHWHDPDGKLEILHDKLGSPTADNARLVYIDNMAPAAALRQDNPFLRGVCVAEEVQSSTYRLGSVASLRRVEQAKAAGSLLI